MKKFTKKQRCQIYLNAAMELENELRFNGYNHAPIACCHALDYVTNLKNGIVIYNDLKRGDYFPEFELFNPSLRYSETFWFGYPSKESNKDRVIALLLASEMCK